MADSFVRVPADSVGKRVDATSLDVGADTVYRQRVVIGDNSATAQFATVTGGALVITGTINVSAMPTTTVTLAAGSILDSISATVGVKGQVSLGPGTSNIGTINDISRTVQVAIGTPFILQGISTTVQVAVGTPFTLQGISTTVTVAGNINISATATAIIGGFLDPSGNQKNVVDSANTALRVNVVAGSSGGVSQVDGTTFSTQAANFVPIGGIFDDVASDTLSENDAGAVRLTTNRGMHVNLRTDGGTKMDDSTNSALRVNVVAGGAGGGAVFGQVSAGASLSTTNIPVLIGGNDSAGGAGGIARTLLLDTSGRIILGASTNNIGAVSNAAGTALMGAVSLAAGTAKIGFIGKISATVTVTGVVALGAGAAVIGTVNNISATVVVGGEIANGSSLSTTNKPVLMGGNDSAGGAGGVARTLLLDTSGRIILGAGANNIGAVSLGAGTAVIGDLNAISRTVQVAIGTPFTLQGISTTVTVAGTVGLTAGTANIGTINGNVAHSASVTAGVIPVVTGFRAHTSASAAVANLDCTYQWGDRFGRQVTVKNHPSLLPSASHGPKCVTVSTSATVALVAAPGAGLSVYVTQIACTNGSSTLTRADAYAASQTASCVTQMYMAANGGGFVQQFDPPVQILSNTALNSRVKPNVSQAIFVVHFYVGPK